MPEGLQSSGFDDIYYAMLAEDLLEQRRQDALDEMYDRQFQDTFPQEVEMPSFDEFNFDIDFDSYDIDFEEFEANRFLDAIYAEHQVFETRFAQRDKRRERNRPLQTRDRTCGNGWDQTTWKRHRKHRWSQPRSLAVLPADIAAH